MECTPDGVVVDLSVCTDAETGQNTGLPRGFPLPPSLRA